MPNHDEEPAPAVKVDNTGEEYDIDATAVDLVEDAKDIDPAEYPDQPQDDEASADPEGGDAA